MDDNMKKDLLVNEIPPTTDEPPPYSPDGQGLPPSVDSQPYPHQPYPPAMATQQPVAQYPQGPQVVHHHVDGHTAGVFEQEEAYAECVRFWWCRPIGWVAKAELNKARSLYLAGDYEGAQAAARCANVWSTVGLISGLLLVAAIVVATYCIIAYGIN